MVTVRVVKHSKKLKTRKSVLLNREANERRRVQYKERRGMNTHENTHGWGRISQLTNQVKN